MLAAIKKELADALVTKAANTMIAAERAKAALQENELL